VLNPFFISFSVAGTLWTPDVAKKWRVQLKEVVPARPDWLAMRIKLLK
jgi:hypothetical protein